MIITYKSNGWQMLKQYPPPQRNIPPENLTTFRAPSIRPDMVCTQ